MAHNSELNITSLAPVLATGFTHVTALRLGGYGSPSLKSRHRSQWFTSLLTPLEAPGRQAIFSRRRREASCHLLAKDEDTDLSYSAVQALVSGWNTCLTANGNYAEARCTVCYIYVIHSRHRLQNEVLGITVSVTLFLRLLCITHRCTTERIFVASAINYPADITKYLHNNGVTNDIFHGSAVQENQAH